MEIALPTLLMDIGAPAALVSSAATVGSIIPAASTIATIGGALSAIGNVQQSRAASSAAKANATIAEQNAAQIASQTVAAEEKQRKQAILRAGAARATAASRGLGISSASDILADNAAQEELDILTLRHNGLLQQNSQLQTAALERSQAKQIKKALPWQIATSALSSYGSFKQQLKLDQLLSQ